MGERTDLLKIKPEGQPSIINHAAGIGGLLATIPISFVNSQRLKKTLEPLAMRGAGLDELFQTVRKMGQKNALITLGVGLVGATVGGLIGKNTQESEQKEGRTVKDPGYLNKGLLSGFYTASLIATPISMALTHFSSGAIPILAITTTAIIGGPIIGSIVRKNSLQRDYDKAVNLQAQEKGKVHDLVQTTGVGQATSPVPPVTYKNSVTADEAALLAEKQNANAASHQQHAATSKEAGLEAQRA